MARRLTLLREAHHDILARFWCTMNAKFAEKVGKVVLPGECEAELEVRKTQERRV
jgi:hypothetical protein